MGKALLADMALFIEDLLARGRADRTVKRHCDHLWLLGGEIIREINMSGGCHCDPHARLLKAIDADGGPLCRHLDSQAEQEAFDATCRALYCFLRTSKEPHRGGNAVQSTSAPREPAPPHHASPPGGPARSARTIAEADWKHFKRVHPIALERCYERILRKVARAAASPGATAQQRYRQAWEAFTAHDMDLRLAFDNFKRSAALSSLTAMRRLGLVTEEEFAGFSAEVRNKVLLILASWQ